MYETTRLLFRKADFPDWKPMYRNVWRHPESARYMLWSVTTSEADAQERMQKSIVYQFAHPAWLVIEKESGQAIGFAGLREENGICEDTGICVGPAFTGKGYGQEILNELVRIAKENPDSREFIVSCRSENMASRNMILRCGFTFSNQELREDPRDGTLHTLEFYKQSL